MTTIQSFTGRRTMFIGLAIYLALALGYPFSGRVWAQNNLNQPSTSAADSTDQKQGPQHQSEPSGSQSQIFLPVVENSTQIQTDSVESSIDDHNDYYLAEQARLRNEPPFEAPIVDATAAGPRNEVGQWGPIKTWPFVFQGAANLPDGRIVAWGANNRFSFSGGNSAYASVWDPETDQLLSRNHNDHPLFCSIPVMLEDGRVLTNGGDDDTNKTSIFDYRTNQWTRTDNMNRGRWYPGTVALPNGQVFTMLGDTGGPYPEVWTEGSGWSQRTGANLNNGILNYGGYQSTWLPYVNLMPNGNIFHSGPTTRMNIINPNGNGSIRSAGLNNNWYPKYSTTIMYDVGKILVAGGAANNSSASSATNKAMILDINGSTPTKTNIAPMRFARKFSNGVMLPTGEVLVIGGNSSGDEFSDAGSALAAEIWNPTTQAWREVASMAVPRNYHGVALLMTDGRVWSGGSGLCNCSADHPNHEVYSPPYLFDSNGSLATRPQITAAPDVITYGRTFSVQASSSIQKFSLIKMSGVTHHMNSDLRFLDILFSGSGGSYSLTVPSNPNVLTPGYWMLFALNGQGVPSIAEVIQVSSTTPPPPGDGSGEILREWWTGISGTGIADLVGNAAYPNNPNGSGTLSRFEGPTDWAENYGSRIRGYVHPPISGQYRFWIASDDNGQLRLSSNADPANASQIASVPSWTSSREWGKFSQQQSALITLQAGEQYYIEALQKESGVGDNLAVAWQIPGSARAVIEGEYLSPYLLNQPPVVTNPGNQSNAEGDSINLSINASDAEDDTITYSASGLPSGLSINNSSGLIAGTVSSAGTYNVSVTATDTEGGSDSTNFTWLVNQPPPPGTVLQANFNLNVNGFSYADDTFRGTTAPGYASGSYRASEGFSGGGLRVLLGGIDDNDISGMSGSWQNNFSLSAEKEVTLSFRYKLDQSSEYESNEFSQVLLSVDGLLVGDAPNEYIDRIAGDGNGGGTRTTGWQIFEVDLGLMASGSHQIRIGGYNNLKTFNNESTTILIDEVLVVAVDPPNEAPVINNPGAQDNTEGDSVTLVISGNDPDGDSLSFSANGLPTGLTINSNSGTIAGTLPVNSAGVYNSTVTVGDGNGGNDSTTFIWNVQAAPALVLNSISSSPQPQNSTIIYGASFNGGLNPRFKWLFGDGSPETAYSNFASTAHIFAQPGRYIVTLTATDDTGQEVTQQFSQLIHRPLTAQQPAVSMSMAYESRAGNARLWNVNPDNNTVSLLNVVTRQKVAEISVGNNPRAVAIAPDGRVWITNKDDATISIIDSSSLTVVQTVSLPHASRPHGIAFAPNGNHAFAALEATGVLLKLNPTTAAQIGNAVVGPNPRHLSILADSSKVYVSRFITPPVTDEGTANPQVTAGGAEVLVVNVGNMSIDETVLLQFSNRPDAEATGRGLPNYLGPAVISPDGTTAWVPSKQDNIARGTLRDGQPLNHDQTVRSISSYIDLSNNQEDPNNRIDHDNGGIASSGQFGRYGAFLFVALEGSREVAVVDTYARAELFRINVGRAPQGIVVSPDGSTLYVHNFMDRSVSIYDLNDLINEGLNSISAGDTIDVVASERLSSQVLNGKQLFYDAKDTRLALEGYISCAACHNDGGQDGRVWDMSSLGEGLRNTTDLNGHAGMGQGPLHWSANFDEIQDFEIQIRDLAGGTGLMSDSDFNATQDPLGAPKAGLSADLDALAAYVSSLNSFGDSPGRNADGTLTIDAEAGKLIFQNESCASCHVGQGFSDSPQGLIHNIGTIQASSGNRLGQPLTGIDTPTLRGLWASGPYLHNGSAATLGAAIQAHDSVSLNSSDLNQLVAYLQQIDDNEPGPEVNPVLLGDVNCDNELTSVDALFIMQHTVSVRSSISACPLGDQATDIHTASGDVNDSGRVDAIDALLILQCVVGQNNVFCPLQ